MPIYEYECKACGIRHEALQKMSDDPLTDCPDCSEPALKKLVSAAAFRLKGGGWYETDFKSGDKKNIAKSESSPQNSANAKKDDKKATKKPDTKKVSSAAK